MTQAIQRAVDLNTVALGKTGKLLNNSAFIERLCILSQFNLKHLSWHNIGSAIKLSKQVRPEWQNKLSQLSRDHAALFEKIDTRSIIDLAIIERASASFFITTALTDSFTGIESSEIAIDEADAESLEQEKQALTEELQQQTIDRLEFLLTTLDPGLSTLLHGAKAALESKLPDYTRHFSISLRELFTQVIHRIAPDTSIREWSQDKGNYHQNKPTRKARLNYIFRNLDGNKAFEKFLEQDIKLTVDVFLPLFQKGTHELSISYTNEHVKFMLLKMETVLMQILEIWYTTTVEFNTKPLQTKDLNDFFAGLPDLEEDDENFARDIQTLRQLPVEVDAWD